MKFIVPDAKKWASDVENTLTDWAVEHVQEWFEVEDVEDLTKNQIEEIEKFLSEQKPNWYTWAYLGFENIIDLWEAEHYDD